ncbi:MerR family transcriptional regulator [Angustibacter luteus]|uniref:MerR family transcriptional regulator n=1 Tax=Angustibacter luteus TaxID=658456 RepID=A0ABW1JEP3_9ACTN
MDTNRTWSVGEVAETSGITVRTLHHWDELGVLRPSRHSMGGRRRYTEDDLARLYVVLTLRGFGMSLDAIRRSLDGGVDVRRLLTDQVAQVDRAVTALVGLRSRLAAVLDTDEGADGRADLANPAELLALVRAARGADDAVARELSEQERERVAEGAAAVGPALPYLLEVEWPQLYRRAEELRRSGAAPDSAAVQQVVARMQELSARFGTGDGRGAGAAVRAAWRQEPAALSGESQAVAGPWRELAEFVEEARRIRSTP